mmetsp:Transcript_12376/g.14929  ORF Transcript_12376/g.14929 Transcript_12376/m.14929 type:complete len:229 (-) Transcript_12376:7-693(-)
MFVTISAHEGAESIPVENGTIIKDLIELSAPLFGVDPNSSTLLLNNKQLDSNSTIAGSGVQDGDLLLLVPKQLQQSTQQRNGHQTSSGLDFGSLLTGMGGGGGGGLNLIPNIQRANSTAVQWAGMSLDDVFSNNKNPAHMVEIIRSHPNVWKELNHHNPKLAATLRDGEEEVAITTLRNHILTGGTNSFMGGYEQKRKDSEMEARLAQNPYDEEANAYFGEKINQKKY